VSIKLQIANSLFEANKKYKFKFRILINL